MRKSRENSCGPMETDIKAKSKFSLKDAGTNNMFCYHLAGWLGANRKKIFASEQARGRDYVAVCQSPPKMLHFFTKKEKLMRFLEKNGPAVYAYRKSDQMILML